MTTSAAEPRPFKTIGVIGLGTMGAGIAEVFARNGYAVVGVEQNDEALARGRQYLEHSTARAVKREKMTEAEQADLLGRITFSHHAQGPHRRRRRRRGGRGVARGQEGRSSASSTRSSRRTRSSRPTPRSLSVTEISTANGRPGPGHRRALLQPRAGAGPGRDRPHGRHRGAGARRREDPGRGGSARTRSSAATRPASSPTPCSSATSTTRSRCTRAATPPARTSTPRCATAAATRWARSRCST